MKNNHPQNLKHPNQSAVGDRNFAAELPKEMGKQNKRHSALAKAAHGSAKGSGDYGGTKTVHARIRRSLVTTGITPRGSNVVSSEPYSGEVGSGV